MRSNLIKLKTNVCFLDRFELFGKETSYEYDSGTVFQCLELHFAAIIQSLKSLDNETFNTQVWLKAHF